LIDESEGGHSVDDQEVRVKRKRDAPRQRRERMVD